MVSTRALIQHPELMYWVYRLHSKLINESIMKKHINFLLAGIVILSSCSKKLDLSPISTVSDASYWKTPDQVDAFVTGIHTQFRADNGNFFFLGELRSDIFGLEPGASGSFTSEATQGLEVMWLQKLDVGTPG